MDSVAPVKTLLSTITQRLQLKEKKFTVDTAAQLEAISNPWANLHLIDPEFDLQHTDKVSQKSLSPLLKDFISHCCRQQHYFFEIKKCGEDDCTLCTLVRLSKKEFERIKPFPNPMIKDNRYYKSFRGLWHKNVRGVQTFQAGQIKEAPILRQPSTRGEQWPDADV